MKKFLLTLFLISLPMPATLSMQHVWDFEKDKPFWGINHKNAACPGPHFKSIWFKDHPTGVMNVCIDKDSIIKLDNGGRARFVNVSFAKDNTRIRGGPGYTTYRSKWYQVDCEKGTWALSSGYSISNKGSGYWKPISGKSGWFEYIYDQRPIYLGSLTPFRTMTFVSEETKFFCKNM